MPNNPTTERGAVQQVIRAVRDSGWEMTFVYDGGEDVPVRTEPEAIEAIFAVDDAFLNFEKDGETGWVRFVLGNSPEEVAADWTTNLDAVETLTSRWW